MTLEELGVFLRTEREKRGYNVNEVAARLKISPRTIRALEEGEGGSLPHAVYVRGFVRSYAAFLGIDETELGAALAFLEDDASETAMTTVYSPSEMKERRGRGGLLPVAALALCLAGGILFWVYRDADFFSEGTQLRLLTAQPAPPIISETKNAAPTPILPAPMATAPVSPAVGERQESVSPAPLPESALIAEDRPAMETSSSTVSTASAPARPADRHHKLIVTALDECWIHSSADSSDTRQFSLRKGDTFALTFSDKLTLKLGNAGGVRIRYDGVDMPAPGKDGQVRTLIFPPPAE